MKTTPNEKQLYGFTSLVVVHYTDTWVTFEMVNKWHFKFKKALIITFKIYTFIYNYFEASFMYAILWNKHAYERCNITKKILLKQLCTKNHIKRLS